MSVQVIEIDDPVDRSLFEIYAAVSLGTLTHNSFETH